MLVFDRQAKGGGGMQRKRCIRCGFIIYKSAEGDPYICRECENAIAGEEARYAYLDNL
ncbi:hypothetical protein KY347_00840 [Candidatus Woesearchaeota archaeon]|nr:hypothetical protein [Candidatus Woesearchaeota archaeon]